VTESATGRRNLDRPAGTKAGVVPIPGSEKLLARYLKASPSGPNLQVAIDQSAGPLCTSHHRPLESGEQHGQLCVDLTLDSTCSRVEFDAVASVPHSTTSRASVASSFPLALEHKAETGAARREDRGIAFESVRWATRITAVSSRSSSLATPSNRIPFLPFVVSTGRQSSHKLAR
jgi:hypothetical protein